jgi:hypothetical protein
VWVFVVCTQVFQSSLWKERKYKRCSVVDFAAVLVEYQCCCSSSSSSSVVVVVVVEFAVL